MNTNQMIRNIRSLFLIMLPFIFVFSSCSKEEKSIPELGKWILFERLIADNEGNLKWENVDEDIQEIEFLEKDIFKGIPLVSFCMHGQRSTYNSTKQIIEIEFEGGCGTSTYSYKIEDDYLLLKHKTNENFTEKYQKN